METRDVLNNHQKHSTERQKVTRLIDYLMQLTSLRSKLVRDIDEYDKVLWLSDVPHERGCFTQAWGSDKEHDPDEWLEVQSRREPELPTVPAQCREWLNHQALLNKADFPELLPEITRQIQSPHWREGSDQPKTIPHTERLENHPDTQGAWDCYLEDKWLPWTEEHNSWEKAHKVYSALFAIHQEQLRLGEEYELVLGLGLLTWQTSSGRREGSDNRVINRQEAEAIAQRIVEMCGDSRYDNKTMGVVVLQGEAQAALIESQLLERLGAEEMERRRLICGNPYSFQGDERDIIILSLVAANNERIGPLAKPADERRFNVAASRARDQMILFHSVTRDDISTHDLRLRLLDFFDNTRPPQIAGIERDELERRAAKDNRSVMSPPKPFDSWFEVDVALELLRRGFIVIPQYEVAGKRIDLVVEGGQARLAVECDGDNWHGADHYEADMQRQRQLERCRWEFFRVRESAFYANTEGALAGLWKALEERGIFPNSECVDLSSEVVLRREDCDSSDRDAANDDDSLDDDKNYSPEDLENDLMSTGRRAEEITAEEIQDAILKALSKCPNQSCTLHSLTARVLKEVGVLTRGKPREEFERRAMRNVSVLEKRGRIETYKAKNRRLRLVSQETA